MAKLGPNLRCVVDVSKRDVVRSLFADVFGAEVSHPTDSMDVLSFGGSNIGFEFVEAAKALPEDQQRDMGVWIEIQVDDVDSTCKALEERGLKRLEYRDQEHSYYQVPGGPVFRVA